MKKKRISIFSAILTTVFLAALAIAQTPAPAGQADTSSAQSETAAPTEQSGTPSQGAEGEMPNTASPLALLALVGVGSLGAGVAAQRFSKRHDEK